jgi:flagellar biosynthesis/type III secretory pathway protein FliH
MEFVLKIARKVCLKEVQSDPQYVHRLVATMVEQCGTREQLKIRLSVADFEAVAQLRATLAERFGELKNLAIEASSSLEPGNCEVESDLASFTASLQSQLEIIDKAVLGATA